MKKLLTIALLLMTVLTAEAQGVWSAFEREADELTGEPGGKYLKFTNDTIGAVTIRDGDDWTFVVESYHGNFFGIVYDGAAKRVPIVKVLIGLYDSTGRLIEKYDNDIEGDEHLNYRSARVNSDWTYTPGSRAKLKKMVSGMLEGKGYVRFVIKRVNMPDFDLKVMPYRR